MDLAAVLLHGFGARYDLPIALSLFLYAGAGVVVISFVLVVLFTGEKLGRKAISYPRRPLPLLLALGRSRTVRVLAGAIGLLFLAAIISTGLFGIQDQPASNPSEYLLWIYFWAGLVILSGLVGNLWTLFNPWAALFDLATRGRPPAPRRELPARLGIWVAVGLYFLFAFFELASGQANRPRVVGSLALIYTAMTIIGMAVFGRRAWLERCEAFSVLFAVVGRFSPVETERDESGRLGGVWLRPYGAGLLQPWGSGWDRVTFLILMLSSLAFDGLVATPPWFALDASTYQFLGGLGTFQQPLVRGLGLAILTAGFLLIFNGFAQLMIRLGRGTTDNLQTITAFALTLVPIALVYNAAHNYSYLVVQSQALIPLLADPFGRGWTLLPTQGFTPSFALAGAALVWYVQVLLIVFGHVIAVYLAHLRAGERFRTAQRALLSQYPMLILMVLYTMTSLWILAQPITQGG